MAKKLPKYFVEIEQDDIAGNWLAVEPKRNTRFFYKHQ